MFSLFSNKKEGKRSIILDIQSGLVRGALIVESLDNENDRTIHILSVVTKSISGKTHIVNAEHLTKRVLKLVAEVIEHLSRDNNGKTISEISYILSSPWIFSKLKSVKVNYEKETEITTKIVSDIVKEEIKNNSKTSDIRPIEQKIFEIKLNGYPMELFEGKRAHALDVSISTSFSSGVLLDKIKSTVDKHIHIKKHSFYSALLMQYAALRELLKDKNEFIYIHIHSEITDLIIIKDGLCKHIASFPFGISSFLRKITSGTKGSMEASDSLLSLFQGGKLSEEEKNKVDQIINPLLHEWSDLCIQSFQDIFDITTVPRTVYLYAHSHFDIFKQALMYKSEYNFNVIPYDSIDSGSDIIFEKGVAQSAMIKIYALALDNVI